MSMFGGLGRAVKAFATPDNLMQIGAILKDTSSGGMDNFMNVQRLMATRQDRQRALDLEERQKTAIANLLGQFKPDTQTPQMNDLIGQLSDRQKQFGEAALPMEKIRPPTFDIRDPATIGAVGQYLQSGGGFGDVAGLQNLFRPPATKYEQFNPYQDTYGIDPISGQRSLVQKGQEDPSKMFMEQYRQAQIDNLLADAEQKKHAARKPYSSGRGGGGAASVPPNFVLD
jgi:hypothetical protein